MVIEGAVDLAKPPEQMIVEAASNAARTHPMYNGQSVIVLVRGPQQASMKADGFITPDDIVGALQRQIHAILHQG